LETVIDVSLAVKFGYCKMTEIVVDWSVGVADVVILQLIALSFSASIAKSKS